VALHDTGTPTRAIAVLEQAHRRRPPIATVLAALASYLSNGATPKPPVDTPTF